MKTKYTMPRDTRFETRTVAGTSRGGKLVPAMCTVVRESESAVLSQTINVKLDSPAGVLITQPSVEYTVVAVPAQAIHALKNDTTAYAGSDEVLRQELLSGSALFTTETEGTVSKTMGIMPRSVSGTKVVNEAARLAKVAAENYLRRRKYVNAAQLPKTDDAINPALIGETALDRLNGVLDPENRVNGAVDLAGTVKVKGKYIGKLNPEAAYYNSTYGTGTDTAASTADFGASAYIPVQDWSKIEKEGSDYIFHDIWGDLTANSLSLTDFYQAQKMDELVKVMRKMVDDNPEHGEELVARFAHGLSVEVGKQPFVIASGERLLNMSLKTAMDGPSLDEYQTNIDGTMSFTIPVPATEFGCVIVTFISVKPDETIASQPHPILSDVWSARNYLVDELAVDPVPVRIRELYADCAVGDENTIAMYVGNNHLMKNYLNYGFHRATDMTKVANKSAIWQLEIPLSVTPESVIYPTNLSHYPFPDQTADIVQYNVTSRMRVNTPIIFGPTPVEELAAIETENVFNDV